MVDSITTGTLSYQETVKAIKEYRLSGGDLHSKEFCSRNLISVLLENYWKEYGLFMISPYDEDDGYYLNPNRETELELHKRPSGIVYDLEWIRKNGFDFKEDCA